MLVKATNVAKEQRLKLKELHRIPEVGETFEVTDERFEYLSGKNRFGFVVVEKVEVPVEEPKKRRRRKVKESTND